MREIKFILSKCETSAEAVSTIISMVVLYSILPIVFGYTFGWLCGVLMLTTELSVFPAIIRVMNNHGQFEQDKWEERK